MITLQEATDVGFEFLKLHRAAHAFFWLADGGWEGGYEIIAVPYEPGTFAVSVRRLDALQMASPSMLS